MARRIAATCLTTLAIAFTSVCCSAEALPSRALNSIKEVCPQAPPERLVFAIGDLNGDRISDVAIVFSCKSPEDQELMVLRGQLDGSYKTAYRSEVWPWNGRSEIELEVRNEALVVSEHCAYNCNPEWWKSTYKFKMRHNQLILAGEDHSETVLSGKDLEFETKSGNSVNYLNQKVIYWERTTTHGYSEKKLSFNLKAPLALANFNLVTCQVHRFCMQTTVSMPKP